jgi:hypothetical protein
MAGFYALGADLYPFNPSVMKCPHPLKVRMKTALGYIVGMADVVPGHRFFTTHITYSGHGYLSIKVEFIIINFF